MTCASCGRVFNAAVARLACRGCSFSGGGCGKVRCSACGAESETEPAFLARLRRRFGRRRHPAGSGACRDGVSPLTAGRAADEGEVVRLAARDSDELRRLVAFGILPGARVRLIQRYPAFVLQIGQSQLALDRETAAAIHVHWSQ